MIKLFICNFFFFDKIVQCFRNSRLSVVYRYYYNGEYLIMLCKGVIMLYKMLNNNNYAIINTYYTILK